MCCLAAIPAIYRLVYYRPITSYWVEPTAKGSFSSNKNKDGAASSFCFDLVMAAGVSQHLLQEWQHCWGGWVHQYLPGAGSVIGIPIAKAL